MYLPLGRPRSIAALALLLATTLAGPAAPLPKINVAPGGRGFVDTAGRPFQPLGVTYYRPGTGWAPQVWKQFDPEATRRDFAQLRSLGANCVRVFLTYGSFLPEPGRLDPDALRKLDEFVNLAEAAGLYVHPTGPDHWEGVPDWAKTDRLADPVVLDALTGFWRGLAAHLRQRGAVFAFDLLNEPEVAWDTPALRQRWPGFLAAKYGQPSALAQNWKRKDTVAFESIGVPPKADAEGDPWLRDYQSFRESVAVEWTSRQAAAIHQTDPDALVTAGLIQWSVPVVMAHVGHYAAFRPAQVAPFLDFLSFHFYPLENGAYTYGGPEAEARNLAYLECLAREHARYGKPVVIGEFGWYGGGQPRAFKNAAPAGEEEQARWCRRVVESTRGLACGWLNWGFRDQPEATDVSQFTGLVTSNGTLKAWGREFQKLSLELARSPAPATMAPAPGEPPELDWARLTTSRRAADDFRARYFEAYRNHSGSGRSTP